MIEPRATFLAAFHAPCEHGITPVSDCADCRLTDAEIGDLVALWRPYLKQQEQAA